MAAFEGGSARTLAGFTSVPTTFGLAAQPPFSQAGVPTISIASRVLRPKVAPPQMRRLSFVWNGPLITSVAVNWISVQKLVREAR